MGRIAVGLVLGCLLVFSGSAWGQVGGSIGSAGPGVGSMGTGPGSGLGTSPLVPAPPAAPNTQPPMIPQQPGIAPGYTQSGPVAPAVPPAPNPPTQLNPPNPTPGSQQPGSAPPGQAPLGTSCSSELSATPGFLCPLPGTLPNSNTPEEVIPAPNNSAPNQGMQSAPTSPGAPGVVPGSAASPFFGDVPPLPIGPSTSEGVVTPLGGG
jgi:hypothetical protein